MSRACALSGESGITGTGTGGDADSGTGADAGAGISVSAENFVAMVDCALGWSASTCPTGETSLRASGWSPRAFESASGMNRTPGSASHGSAHTMHVRASQITPWLAEGHVGTIRMAMREYTTLLRGVW